MCDYLLTELNLFQFPHLPNGNLHVLNPSLPSASTLYHLSTLTFLCYPPRQPASKVAPNDSHLLVVTFLRNPFPQCVTNSILEE